MAFSFVTIMIILVCQVNNLASTCPDKCESSNNFVIYQNCSLNITFKETINNVYQQVSVCCNEELSSSAWALKYVNKTLAEVTIVYDSCNTSYVEFKLLFDTYSLNIKNNNISQISFDYRSERLRDFDLSSNKLKYVTKGLFTNFPNLRKLILSKNEIGDISQESFDGLSKLESLDLSENNLTILSNVFKPLKNLQHLNLSRNKIEFIHENYFNNWLLQHLDVSHNNLKKLAPGALQLLPNLARLLLTDNPHLGITQLDTQLLVGTGRRLQQIDASRTGLYQVPEAFTHSVRFLSLVGNRISAIRCGDLDSYPLLQSLDFSENKVTNVEDDSLGRLEMLLFLNLNKNFLTTIPKSLPDELKYLSINNNMIKNLSIPDFKGLPNLRILMLQNNNIRYIEDHVFDDLLSLEMLDLSKNPIQMLTSSTFDGPLSLQDLRLCYINLSMPEQEGSFPMSSPESVQMLHLQASPGLARQLLADSAALAALSHLQYLDLRMNNLTAIRNDLLFYLGQLKTLRLHGNQINCSAELWLKDWMNSNNSLTNGETCYYSTSEAKPEINKYNCTFPETFTISESLPPVNLYSTEMINKLLRYYGYLNNKTEKSYKRQNKNKNEYNNNLAFAENNRTLNENVGRNLTKPLKKQNLLNSRHVNKISLNDFLNETSKIKDRILDQNKLQNDQFSIDHRLLDAESFPSQTRTQKKEMNDNISEIRKNKSGKRLNTPLEPLNSNNNRTKSNVSVESTVRVVTSSPLIDAANVTIADHGTSVNEKREYSPYQSADNSYAQYMAAAAVTVLIVMCVVLWVSFRLRYRRREPAEDASDQIEVSNISGGVLW